MWKTVKPPTIRKTTLTVWEVLYYDPNSSPGPNGDHTHIYRTLDKRAAEAFCIGKSCYGAPAYATNYEASRATAKRWGLA